MAAAVPAVTAVRERYVVETFMALTDTLVSDFDPLEFLTMLVERSVELLDVSAAGGISMTRAHRAPRRPVAEQLQGAVHDRTGQRRGSSPPGLTSPPTTPCLRYARTGRGHGVLSRGRGGVAAGRAAVPGR